MQTARVFRSGNSQAVRLPKEFRINSDRVYIRKEGDMIIITPVEKSWEPLIRALDMFTPDFMEDRDQPIEQQEREPLDS